MSEPSIPPNSSEPHNPFYLLLLIASMFFVVTTLAYAVMPMLEEDSLSGGRTAPTSALRRSLRDEGWKWVLVELVAMILLGLASMLLDRHRLRRLQNDSSQDKITPPSQNNSPTTAELDHERERADREAAQRDRPT